jgi:ribonuclease HI
MEASILPITQRFKEQQDKFWVKNHTLPKKHPLWKIRSAIDTKCKRFESPLQRIATRLETLDLSDMEKVEAFCLPPWQKRIPVTIPDREEAKNWANTSPEPMIFVDASYRKGKTGIGMFHPTDNNHQEGFRFSKQIGQCEGLTATYGETLAIKQAIEFVNDSWHIPSRVGNATENTTYVVVSDSQTAIRQIGNPRNQTGQAIVRKIYLKLHELESKQGPNVRLQWVPAHTAVIGSEVADQLAKRATEGTLEEIKGLTLTTAMKRVKETWKTKDNTSKYDVDSALPGNHTKTLYDERPYKEAAVLCQLRTGKSRLHGYLAKIRAVESSQCECTGSTSETVRHFLFECSRWNQHREKLREVAGDRWGDLAFFLGGRTERKKPSGELLDGPRKSWKPDIDIVNRTIEFAIATGRLS